MSTALYNDLVYRCIPYPLTVVIHTYMCIEAEISDEDPELHGIALHDGKTAIDNILIIIYDIH